MIFKDPLLNWWWLSVGAAAVMIASIALIRHWRRRRRTASIPSSTQPDALGFTLTIIDGRAFGESGYRAAITAVGADEQRDGLPADAIVGWWSLDESAVERLRRHRPGQLQAEFLEEPQSFIENPRFIELLHRVIATHPPGTAAIAATVGIGGNGEIVMADNRNTEAVNEANPEDFFGCFRVVSGSIVSYERNERHRLFTRTGLFRLPRPIHEAMLRELRAPAFR